jgi:hypothetical protein
MRLARFLLLCFPAVALTAPVQLAPEGRSCPTSSLLRDSAPTDPNADPVGPADWYINADRTIWAGPVPQGGWASGGKLYSGDVVVGGQKTYWVRPQGTQLVISGHRLDANAPPLQAHIPCCYPTGFQIVGLLFPTEGCWEVQAKAGDSELRFVTHVKPPTADKSP